MKKSFITFQTPKSFFRKVMKKNRFRSFRDHEISVSHRLCPTETPRTVCERLHTPQLGRILIEMHCIIL
jgi:hypothetical protein